MEKINKKSEMTVGVVTLLIGLLLFWMSIAGYGSNAISFGHWDMTTWYLGLYAFLVSSVTVLIGIYLIRDGLKR